MLVPVSLYAEAATRTSVRAEGKPVPRGTLFKTENPKEMFNQKVAETDRYGIVMLRGWQEEPEQLDEKKKDPKVIDENKIPESAEEIEAMFGSPDEPEPLKAHEDAPRPFKAMMAALNLGNDQLAYEYSKKWVAYLDKIEKATTDVTGLTGKVMRHKGVLAADNDWSKDKTYSRVDGIVNKNIEEELKAEGVPVTNLLAYLDKDLKAQISSTEAFEGEGEELFHDENELRAKVNAALKAKLPAVGNKRVDVYFFFQPGKKYSNVMAKEVEQIYRASKKNKQLNVIAVTQRPVSKEDYAGYSYSVGTTFPAITKETRLPEIFGATNSPEVVIHVPALNKRINEKGLRKAFYIEEVVNVLQREEVSS